MIQPQGIIIFGANGSGKTTLARELAHVLNYKHIDHENYAFGESKVPYTNPRSPEDYLPEMLDEIRQCGAFILSAVTGDFGDVMSQYYELAVYISAPLEFRLERIKGREYDKFGDRVREDGDMYEHQKEFYKFVANRSLDKIEKWAETLECPVLKVDGTKPVEELVRYILRKIQVYSFFGKTVTVTVDRPIGAAHPKHPDNIYPLNYGYIQGEIAPDGDDLDAYILGVTEPQSSFTGKVIAIIHRENDIEDKLVVAPEGFVYNQAEVAAAVRFQEQFYKSTIECL